VPVSVVLPCRKLVSFTKDQASFLVKESKRLATLEGGTVSVSRVVRTAVQQYMERLRKHG